jgi:uncharacterized protein (TIGR02186 family)
MVRFRLTTLAVLVLALVTPARAAFQDEAPDFTEKLKIGISTDEIAITSSFRGADLTIFGAIDGFDQALLLQGKYNIIVTLEGPKNNATVRRKERVLGIWVNTRSMTFEQVPESYSLSSTRDISTIASSNEMGNIGIGVDHMRLVPLGVATDGGDLSEFRDAFRRIRETSGVYERDLGGVRFISSSLFKASVRLPANVPNGAHVVRAYLFRDGAFVAANGLSLRVDKAGLEQFITQAAHQQPLIYGFVAVFLALFTGWGASVILHRS